MKKLTLTIFILSLILAGSATCQNVFEEGYYINQKGEKVFGLLKHEYARKYKKKGSNWVSYKTDRETKEVKLLPTEINGFVIGRDTFTVLKDVHIGKKTFPQDFVEVLEKGKIKVYWHYYLGRSEGYFSNSDVSSTVSYDKEEISKIIESNGVYQYIKTNKDFREILPKLISDAPKLVKKIEDKKYKVYNLEQVIGRYNLFYEEIIQNY